MKANPREEHFASGFIHRRLVTNEGSALRGERCRTKPLASLTGDEVNEAYIVVGLFTAGKHSSLHVYTYRV